MDTKQAHILGALRAQYPEIQVARWKDAVLAAFGDEDVPCFAELIQDTPYIPDAFVIEKEARELLFFEVEVHSPMTDEKLRGYGYLWYCLDFYAVALGLLVVNKHGHINTVPLGRHYAAWLEMACT